MPTKRKKKQEAEARWSRTGVIATVIGVLLAGFALWYAIHPVAPIERGSFTAIIELENPVVALGQPSFLVTLKNNGKGIAHDVVAHFGYVGTPDSSDEFMNSEVNRPPGPNELVSRRPALAPGESVWNILVWARPISEFEMSGIEQGRYFLFVFGYVTYKDDDGKPHRFTYCAVYDPTPKLMKSWHSFNTL